MKRNFDDHGELKIIPGGGEIAGAAEIAAPEKEGEIELPLLSTPAAAIPHAAAITGPPPPMFSMFPPPIDDRVIAVANFIAKFIHNPHLEIEMKLGRIQPSQDQFWLSNLSSESFFRDEVASRLRFEPGVSETAFSLCLDSLSQRSQSLAAMGISVGYVEHCERDLFFAADQAYSKRRVSLDPQSGKIFRSVLKRKLSHASIASGGGGRPDLRITASEEIPIPTPPPEAIPTLIRNKSRKSFHLPPLAIDLTRVDTENLSSRQNMTDFEIEIEIASCAQLRHYYLNDGDLYLHTIQILLDTARSLRTQAFLARK